MPPPALEQARAFETKRKLELVIEWLELQARIKAQASASGRIQVELIWEAGKIKRAKIVDEITIEDLTEKERELVLRAASVAAG